MRYIDPGSIVIHSVVENDGQVLLSVTDLVHWLREMADYYGDGHHGGGERERDAARIVIRQLAEGLQEGYINQLADTVLDRWEQLP